MTWAQKWTKEVEKQIIELDTDKYKLAKLLGVPYSTLCRHIAHPEKTNSEDLRMIARALRFSPEQQLIMFK